jgi:hypothetical protein
MKYGKHCSSGHSAATTQKCINLHKMQNAGTYNQGFSAASGETDNHEPLNYTVFSTLSSHLIVSIF